MSGFYSNLETLTNRMAGMLLSNQDFVKYLYYTNDDPLSQPDISNPLSILGDKFVLQPKPSGYTTEQGVIVEMFLSGDNPNRGNGGMITEYVITFNILVHLDTWSIRNGIRPYRLLNIIDETFNDKSINEISYTKIQSLGSKYIRFDDNWAGYKLNYVLQWNGNHRC
mgnify:CR=1 FL=1